MTLSFLFSSSWRLLITVWKTLPSLIVKKQVSILTFLLLRGLILAILSSLSVIAIMPTL